MTDMLFGELLLAVVLVVCGFAVIDLWRSGHRWEALVLSAAMWAILLIVLAARFVIP